jgi:hypothetical protein
MPAAQCNEWEWSDRQDRCGSVNDAGVDNVHGDRGYQADDSGAHSEHERPDARVLPDGTRTDAEQEILEAV